MSLKTGDCQALSYLPLGIRSKAVARRTAIFSECGTYRYQLIVREPRGFGVATFVMLNPSTADEMKDDPTVRRCRGFAVRWGFQEVRVVNLFALRSTDPKALYSDASPVGPENDAAIVGAAMTSDRVVAAWGVHGSLLGRDKAVSELLYRFNISCLGRTKDGSPKHPLYLKSDSKLVNWRTA